MANAPPSWKQHVNLEKNQMHDSVCEIQAEFINFIMIKIFDNINVLYIVEWFYVQNFRRNWKRTRSFNVSDVPKKMTNNKSLHQEVYKWVYFIMEHSKNCAP